LATSLHCRHSAAFNGLLLDWSLPVTLWLNTPWHLWYQVLEKLRESRGKGILGILIYPSCLFQPWFQEVQQLSSAHFLLPPPHLCVWPHHPRQVEPFVNRERCNCGSCLRLYVKDEVLQTCVLLTTQGDNSRVRWSSSQQCQRVLSIRPYNKKFSTPPSLFNKTCLDRPISGYGQFPPPHLTRFRSSCATVTRRQKASTVKSHDQKWLKSRLKPSRGKYRTIQVHRDCVCCLLRHKRSSPTWVTYLSQSPSAKVTPALPVRDQRCPQQL
jgi:hypothetical protein